MAVENVIKFLTAAKENKQLLLRVQNAKGSEEFSKLAKEAGYEFTAEEFDEFLSESARLILGENL